MSVVRFLCISVLCCLALAGPFPAVAAQIARPGPELRALDIVNATNEDVLSIGFRNGRGMQFLRLDLAPGGSDNTENPGGSADMRVDTGLALWLFAAVPLEQAVRLTLREAPAPELELTMTGGDTRRIVGEARALLPAPEGRPACALRRFRPGMPMKDVCVLLEGDAPVDDNGALLAGLEFAGLVWAARLEPAPDASESDGRTAGDAMLNRLELRRRLDQPALGTLFSALYAQNYVPWQAELPGLDINFTRMPAMSAEKQKELLERLLEYFLASGKGEAGIMLAPADMLPRLADSDEPSGDMQLFTIVLRPASRNLIVDVAAYREGGAAPESATGQEQ